MLYGNVDSKEVWDVDSRWRQLGLDDNDNIYINWMYNTRVHTCTQDGIDVWVHKFKNEVKCAMKQDFRAKYAKV